MFQRYIHGIMLSAEGASVILDQQTGELLSFSSSISQVNFPEKSPDYLSLEEAKEKWLQQLEVTLTYQVKQEDHRDKNQQSPKSNPLTLVYTLQPSSNSLTLDAITGKWIHLYSNKPVEVNQTEPEDLQKLPTDKQKALRILYEYNAIEPIDGEIKPKEPIKRGEIIKMLVAILSNGNYDDEFIPKQASFHDVPATSPYFGAIEFALARGYIPQTKSLQPEKPITRAELAESFTRALGYHSLAELPNLFVASSTDTANLKEKGSISIVTALGIMETINQSFKPDASVTREEAAIYFQKFLEVYNKKMPEGPLYTKSRH
ncbi:S-layer homology domain-containing protein [Brevibacillus laterosporus]|uniref:S-layer homology domain-containing protein n=1 Tax=Brevibacillus laterosporus TaxID=1465 RepID=UPI0003B1A5FC|nr:S-layer homology domain-containing protein [Brevibacillus laterosporus]ERM17401.1 hypothetical protein P615_20750 [Brevibacillus laterosporus PE36]